LSPHTGVGRFTFDQLWLWDGLNIVTIVLGLFAFTEMMELGSRGSTAKISQVDVEMSWKQLWDGTRVVFKEWWLTLRTSVIGVIVGVIPGLGGDAATWICYGHAAQTCKNSENFGKGDIRGVIAVETANNAKEGGALLPTLGFGIPGSSGMAILLGAFLILGITPGPKMLVDNLDLVWGMVWVLVISNILGAVTLYPLSRYMGILAYLRSSLLIPPIMFMAAMGAFLIRNYWQDVVLAISFGFLGYAMKRWKYPRAPLILGFILGPLAEDYFYKSMAAWGIDFMMRPVTVILLILSVLSLAYSGWRIYREKDRQKRDISKIKAEMFFGMFLLMIFVFAFYSSIAWPRKLYPQIVTVLGILFSGWRVLFLLKGLKAKNIESIEKTETESEAAGPVDPTKEKIIPRSERIIMLWLLSFLGLIMVVGFWLAMVIFIPVFMIKFGHENRKLVISYTTCFALCMYIIFNMLMQSPLYTGIIAAYLFG